MFSILWHIYEAVYKGQTIPPVIHLTVRHFLYLLLVNTSIWKVHFPEDSVSTSSTRAPIIAHDISSRCGMWSCVDICFIPDIPQSVQRLQTVSQVQQGSFPCPTPSWSLPASDNLTASPAALSPEAAWRNALLHAEQARAGRHQAQGFRGRLLRVMHNSWPLWTFQLRPLSLMGNPNRDLFIKTISWLFVILASHKGATSHSNIITSSFGSSMAMLHFTYNIACQIIMPTITIKSHLWLD